MSKDTFTVESAKPERLYVKTYHDFLDSTLINGKEKLVFILLKRYLDFRHDNAGIFGSVYPTLDTLSKQSGMSKKTVINIIKNLEKKHLITVKQQGLNKPNIYTINDFSSIWKAESSEEIEEVVKNNYIDLKDISTDVLLNELERREKGLESAPAKAQNQAPLESNIYRNNNTSCQEKSQELERYTMAQIKEIFDYDYILLDYSDYKIEVDTVIEILYDVLNTTKPTIRISGEEKPSMIVIGKLMKLDRESIIYAIEKYKEHVGKVTHPINYMLAILYKAPEQYELEIRNRINNNQY